MANWEVNLFTFSVQKRKEVMKEKEEKERKLKEQREKQKKKEEEEFAKVNTAKDNESKIEEITDEEAERIMKENEIKVETNGETESEKNEKPETVSFCLSLLSNRKTFSNSISFLVNNNMTRMASLTHFSLVLDFI